VAGEHAEGEKGGKKDRIGEGPLKGHLRDIEENILEDKVKGGSILDEDLHLLEEQDDDVNEDQTAQGQTEELQIFTKNITLKGPVTFKCH
jgi:hypothetical protein